MPTNNQPSPDMPEDDNLNANTESDQPETNGQPAHEQGYTLNRARRKLNLQKQTLEMAVANNLLTSFVDEEEHQRIPREEIDAAADDSDLFERLADYEKIKVRDMADAMGVKLSVARKKLRQAGINPNKPMWYEIRGLWELPDTLLGFRARLQQMRDERRKSRKDKREAEKKRKQEKREEERRRRAALRAQLVASFPVWAELDRADQLMLLHIGPPNSGKTHDALNRLAEAKRGWYLAPLRLLAWEVYDRLNARGVPCNLLTGEEHIEVEGAEITAATIEMFNAQNSGEVVIIDEAQMLADADRGWAWTRAMMQCLAPEMHVIAPHTAQDLIHNMAEAANIPIGTVMHERLTPITVSDRYWRLEDLPSKTILVAFSRKMVLGLKTRLESMGRSVSVVYGSLPPEVRRKQAERFASGETEICVATDAVGMGLNLPADHVCFYEVEKYDGREIRLLRPEEVQQIGGRAGRYGFSDTGVVGATERGHLRLIRKLFYAKPRELTHARVAPSVDDLALIPGSLAEKLTEWAQLQSIPQELRSVVKTADMSERIELASMLTDEQVARLGLASAVQLVNAPTRKSTRDFWYDCAVAIIDRAPMPLPPAPPDVIQDRGDLDHTETCIACADIYLWLGHRQEFHEFAEHLPLVKEDRQNWSEHIDDALLRKVRTEYRERYYGNY